MKATASLAILVVALAAGCGGGSKSGAGVAEPEVAEVAEPAPAPVAVAEPPRPGMGQGADAARAKSTFAMYPKGVRFVGGVSVAQLRQSALWPHIETAIASRADREIRMVKDVCKLDPADVVDRAELAIDPSGNAQNMVVVVEGSFTRADAARCAGAMGAKEGHNIAVADEGRVTSYTEGSDTLWVGWPSDNTAVLGDDSHDRAWMQQRLAGKASIRDDDALMEVLANVDTSATGWLAFNDTGNQLAMLAGQLGGRTPTAIYGSVRVTDVAKGEVGFVFGSEGDAKVAVSSLQPVLDQLKSDPAMGGIIGGARVGVYGANAVIEFDLDKQQLERLIQFLLTMPF